MVHSRLIGFSRSDTIQVGLAHLTQGLVLEVSYGVGCPSRLKGRYTDSDRTFV